MFFSGILKPILSHEIGALTFVNKCCVMTIEYAPNLVVEHDKRSIVGSIRRLIQGLNKSLRHGSIVETSSWSEVEHQPLDLISVGECMVMFILHSN